MEQSVLLLRSDGLDQAKHKVPRTLIHSKSFEEIIRPAMHCQMIWAHCWGFQFAISDPDVRKDSCTHMEVVARCLSKIVDASGALPRQLYVVLDNASKDNKNGKMLCFWIKLCLMRVFESIYVAFPIKGHTHGPLDGVGGHAVTRCSTQTFDSAAELISVYQTFLDQAEFEQGTVFKEAYKQDTSADWLGWLGDINLTFKVLTGPKAPHGFRILWRKALTAAENTMSHKSLNALKSNDPNDLMLAVHQHMSDARPYQVVMLMPVAQVQRVTHSLTIQPSGQRSRKSISWEDRKQVRAKAITGCEKGAISEVARDFLVGWIEGTLRREPRPAEYSCLKHRFDAMSTVGDMPRNPHHHACPRPITVMHTANGEDLEVPLP